LSTTTVRDLFTNFKPSQLTKVVYNIDGEKGDVPH
jgi:hypothetical protein